MKAVSSSQLCPEFHPTFDSINLHNLRRTSQTPKILSISHVHALSFTEQISETAGPHSAHILLSLRPLATCRSGKECARRQSLPRHGRALTSVVPLQIAPCSRKLLRLSPGTRRSAAPSASSPHGPCWRWPAAGWWPPPPPRRLDLHILPCYQVRHSLAADGPTDWPLVVCHYF
jgi:hypothetical protein